MALASLDRLVSSSRLFFTVLACPVAGIFPSTLSVERVLSLLRKSCGELRVDPLPLACFFC